MYQIFTFISINDELLSVEQGLVREMALMKCAIRGLGRSRTRKRDMFETSVIGRWEKIRRTGDWVYFETPQIMGYPSSTRQLVLPQGG